MWEHAHGLNPASIRVAEAHSSWKLLEPACSHASGFSMRPIVCRQVRQAGKGLGVKGGKPGDGGKGGEEMEEDEPDQPSIPVGWPAYSAVALSKMASSIQSELLHERIINLCIEWWRCSVRLRIVHIGIQAVDSQGRRDPRDRVVVEHGCSK